MAEDKMKWKSYEEFSAGIDTYRIPQSEALVGQTIDFELKTGEKFTLTATEKNKMKWKGWQGEGEDWYEALEIDPGVFFVDMTFKNIKRYALTFLFNINTKWGISILTTVCEEKDATLPVPMKSKGEPMVDQVFTPMVVNGGPAQGIETHESRDLIGLRAFQVYSPNHMYEHTYMSSKFYAWQCLVGEQRGLGDVDRATCWKLEDNIYVYTFREFVLPVASCFIFNYRKMENNGKFLGLDSNGNVENRPSGGKIIKASMTFYPEGKEPV